MWIVKIIFSLIFAGAVFLTSGCGNVVFAQNDLFGSKQITLINPIRGDENWGYQHDLLTTPKAQYELISKNNLAATWLIRFDALSNPEVIKFLKSLDSKQEIGIFLEITPKLAQEAKVKYNQSTSWHNASSVLVIGYEVVDRKKLIDTVFKKYQEIFGKYPKSVGAWWIDAGSLLFMKEKYGIEASLDVADQFSTDGYQVWGQYWAVPFYPSKVNALMPAQSLEQKIGTVTIQWALRDPFNGFGNGVFESTFSVQANDYFLHDLDTSYFKKLVAIYPQITVGLENDFEWKEFGEEYSRQIQFLAELKKTSGAVFKTMTEFARDYRLKYPDISPNQLIIADDPLGSSGKVVWYQTPNYRVGWFYDTSSSSIRDLRELNGSKEELCLRKKCQTLNLSFAPGQAIDDVNFSSRLMIDDGKLSDFKIGKTKDGAELSYRNQAGTARTIKFLPNDIQIDDKVAPISTTILNTTAQTSPQQVKKIETEITPQFNFQENWNLIWPNLIKFLLLTILFFFLPGWVLSRNLTLSIPLGLTIFTLTTYLLGYIKLDFLIWLLPISGLVAMTKIGFPKLSKPIFNFQFSFFIITVTLGSVTWLLTQVKNGLLYNFGYGYWGPNGHDGIWHLALISQLQKNFPPQNPVFAGEVLTNYHYFYDLLLARSGNLLSINSQDLLFRFFPFLIALLAGLVVYQVVKKIANSWTAVWTVFFVYFGGSFGWLVSYFRDKSFGGETMFWAQQSISTLLNPPYAASIVIFLAGLYLFYEWLEQKSRSNLKIFLIGILWGSLIEFKAYGGVLVLLGLGLYTVEKIIFKKDFKTLPLFFLTTLVSAVVFLPSNLTSSTLFVLSPLWFAYSMVEFQDRLNWQRLNMAIQSGVLWKLVSGSLLGIVIFLLGNLGTRVFGLFEIKKLFKHRLLLYIALLGLLIPLLFIQKGTNWNSVQFFYYSLLILDIFAAIALVNILKKVNKLMGLGIISLIILLTIPTTLDTLRHYLPARPPARLSLQEIEALEFLIKQPDGVVLTLPFDSKLKDKFNAPVPLAFYAPTAYVGAFSGHPTFLDDTINLEILNTNYKGRVNLQRDFFKITEVSKKILKENNISYVYTLKVQNFNEDENKMGTKKIFENEEVKIFKVN